MRLVAIGSVVVLGGAALVGWWFTRPVRQTFYTDGAGLREFVPADQARRVLWQPPVKLAALINTSDEDYEPRLSWDENSLYLVRGRPGANADIYVAHRTPEGFGPPERLDAVCSPDDDLGPELSRDGQHLYFYSNRPGGRGGYDLWVARNLDGQWQPPANLGPNVNGEYNDYAPAASPDGTTLYFASNRPQLPDAQAPDRDGWPATVRETPYQRTYDLYQCTLREAGPTPASAVDALNTEFDDGAPCVSPGGDFLYFASDRPGGRGGFDLYRARRVHNKLLRPENLGPAINTAANELDPGLAALGFGLYFSSDRPAQRVDPNRPNDYNVYCSASRDVYLDQVYAPPPTIHWAALRTSLLWASLALLLLLLLVALWRDARHRRLSLLARCLLASVAVHALLMFLFSFWRVTAAVVDVVHGGGAIQVALGPGTGGGGLTQQVRGDLTDITVPRFAVATPGPAPLRDLTGPRSPALITDPGAAAELVLLDAPAIASNFALPASSLVAALPPMPSAAVDAALPAGPAVEINLPLDAPPDAAATEASERPLAAAAGNAADTARLVAGGSQQRGFGTIVPTSVEPVQAVLPAARRVAALDRLQTPPIADRLEGGPTETAAGAASVSGLPPDLGGSVRLPVSGPVEEPVDEAVGAAAVSAVRQQPPVLSAQPWHAAPVAPSLGTVAAGDGAAQPRGPALMAEPVAPVATVGALRAGLDRQRGGALAAVALPTTPGTMAALDRPALEAEPPALRLPSETAVAGEASDQLPGDGSSRPPGVGAPAGGSNADPAAPEPARGRVRGRVTSAATGAPLAGALVRADLTGGRDVVTNTDADGAYELSFAEMPAHFALTASHADALPKSADVASADLQASGTVLDFELEPRTLDRIVLEAVPDVHHLGNDLFEGQINSQFQKASEGRRYEIEFDLPEGAPPRRARLVMLTRGVQCAHPIAINGAPVSRLRASPADGSFGRYAAVFDPQALRAGPNTLEIRTSSCTGDLDDFEFVNVQIELRR